MLDFSSIVSATTLYNFHTHTQFCDGHASMQEFVTEALQLGFVHLGFTPHGPLSYPSSCNMSRDDVTSYLSEINRLRDLYGHRINIYAAMEIDYVGFEGPADDYYQQLPLDYRIGSVHFIPSKNDPATLVDVDGRFSQFKQRIRQHFDGDIEWVVKSFFKQMMAMVDAGGFDIVGHFDKIGLNASQYSEGIDEQPWYDRLVIDLFENIMDHHLTIEINTKAWLKHNRFFPGLKYFGMLNHYHAPVVINSDAHYPTLLNNGRNEAIRLLDKIA